MVIMVGGCIRYSRETRPWIPFHHDNSNVTINVALSDDSAHEGGMLCPRILLSFIHSINQSINQSIS